MIKKNHRGISEEKPLVRNDVGEVLKEKPWGICHRRGVTKEKSCRKYHGGEITL
jgi:hypothetical protein